MTDKDREINAGGVNGMGNSPIDIHSEDFAVLRKKISELSRNQSRKELLENRVLSIKLQMLTYLDTHNSTEIIQVGAFLKALLHELGIKHRRFAAYVSMHPSNFSSLLSGSRKITGKLAVTLGEIFNISPDMWMKIQAKNELIETRRQLREDRKKFRLSDLIEE